IFAGKLLTQLDFPLELSYLHATRYRNETSGGELFWKAKPEISFIDRDVLIIDDIYDEGHTLSAIIDFCRHAGARQVHTAVLIDKTHDRKARPDLKADFVGLPCEDRYIFGYGMDYKGYWRNAAGIFAGQGLEFLGGGGPASLPPALLTAPASATDAGRHRPPPDFPRGTETPDSPLPARPGCRRCSAGSSDCRTGRCCSGRAAALPRQNPRRCAWPVSARCRRIPPRNRLRRSGWCGHRRPGRGHDPHSGTAPSGPVAG